MSLFFQCPDCNHRECRKIESQFENEDPSNAYVKQSADLTQLVQSDPVSETERSCRLISNGIPQSTKRQEK